MPLQALVYTNDLATPVMTKNLGSRVANIRLMWELPGGLRAIELDWAASLSDAYEFYKKYAGYRLIIADEACDVPVADGNITGLAISPTGVHILANGFWFRHFDQMYIFDDTVQDSQQSTLTYESGGEFRDTGQDFSDWATDSGDAQYQIEVGNLGAYQENNSTLDSDNDFSTSGANADREWYAQRFTANQSANTGQVSIQLKKTGSPAGTITCNIYDEAGGQPSAIVGTASDAVNVSSVGTSYAWVSFTWTGSGPTLAADVPYYIVLKTAGYTYTDGVTELVLGSDADGGQGDVLFKYDADAVVVWTTGGADHITNHRIYPDSSTAISWGFLGSVGAGGNTYIKVYRDYARTYSGWLGEDPTDQAPIRYSIVKAFAYKTTDEIIEDSLTEEVPAVSSDQTNIDSPGTVIGFWTPPVDEGGAYPGEVIEKMCSLSDSSNNQWNYWCKNAPFDATAPQKPIPYFKAQVSDGTYDWKVFPWMLAPGSLSMERNIQEMRNHIRIIYRNMDEDDALSITDTASDSDSISDYWQREAILSGGDLFNTGADQYRDLYLAKYKGPMLGKSIVITSPFICNGTGQRRPLWFPIKYSESYFKIVFYQDVDLFDASWDRLQASQAIAMEYNDATNSLRVHLDLEPNDVDFLLARISAFR